MADLVAKQTAQGTVILAARESKDYYNIRETSFRCTQEDNNAMDGLGLIRHTPYGISQMEDRKLILPSKEAREYLTNLHYLTHLGTKK